MKQKNLEKCVPMSVSIPLKYREFLPVVAKFQSRREGKHVSVSDIVIMALAEWIDDWLKVVEAEAKARLLKCTR